MANSTHSNGKDKRRYPRLITRLEITYQKYFCGGIIAEPVITSSKDISHCGVYFETSELLSVGDILKIKLKVPKIKREIKLVGKVMRVIQLKENERYGVGINFEKIEDEYVLEVLKKLELFNVSRILEAACKKHASDVHFVAGQAPIIRVDGKLDKLAGDVLDADDVQRLLYTILTEDQIQKFEKYNVLDFSYVVSHHARFRVNMHSQKGIIEATFHMLGETIRKFEEYRFAPVIKELMKKHGLLIVAGPASSGKSSTLASIVQELNATTESVIVTIEEPIEYMLTSQKSIVKQREVGSDTESFSEALKQALRQDTNILMVEKIDTHQTAQAVINAAKTKHLVMVGVEAFTTVEALQSIMNLFPETVADHMSNELSLCMLGVITHTLVPSKEAGESALAYELLVCTNPVRRMIREQKWEMIPEMIKASSELGMCSLETSLAQLYKEGKITKQTAIMYCLDLEDTLQ